MFCIHKVITWYFSCYLFVDLPPERQKVAESVEESEELETPSECWQGQDQGAQDGAQHANPETNTEPLYSRAPG